MSALHQLTTRATPRIATPPFIPSMRNAKELHSIKMIQRGATPQAYLPFKDTVKGQVIQLHHFQRIKNKTQENEIYQTHGFYLFSLFGEVR
mmetsp:Transcript_24248/g.31591  ORF Transcript_24248/g.31591 Transcript_24248/m.31591 type:complete len:91 (+) Transcript_24248:344-616(+)